MLSRKEKARIVAQISNSPWTGSGMQNFWLGTYEREKYELFYKELSLGMVVYDIGANSGIYTAVSYTHLTLPTILLV